jgi:hypothetical protein
VEVTHEIPNGDDNCLAGTSGSNGKGLMQGGQGEVLQGRCRSEGKDWPLPQKAYG